MSYAPFFELVTELQTTNRRDFAVAAAVSLDPIASRPLVDGEWVKLNSSYALDRGGDNSAGTADESTVATGDLASFVIHTERGRYDVQAIQKVNVIFHGMYEADTLIADATGLAVGDELSIQDILVGGVVRRGLKKASATAGRVIVGVCTKVSTIGASTKVRFLHMGNYVRG